MNLRKKWISITTKSPNAVSQIKKGMIMLNLNAVKLQVVWMCMGEENLVGIDETIERQGDVEFVQIEF